MNPEQLIDALQFNNQSFICQQVNAVSTVKLYVFVLNGKFNLKLKRDPGPVQFISQALLVSRFKQSRPKLSMHLNRTTEDLV